ncbi:MAG: hypothetical protein HY034_02180 [Nitrospirae bacterium]|nr:hypothetical protein [Nitrospirota bacterium]
MGLLKITEEWKCEFCDVYTKLETKIKADKGMTPTLSDPISWIFDAMNCRTNPDTDWLRHRGKRYRNMK